MKHIVKFMPFGQSNGIISVTDLPNDFERSQLPIAEFVIPLLLDEQALGDQVHQVTKFELCHEMK